MPKVFVHGNPETDAIWGRLVDELAARGVDDVVLLSPPAFGAPVPDGFEFHHLAYRAWLIEQLERLADESGGPVDVLAHDWGSGHLFGVVAERPDLLRTWAADCVGLLHPDYVWHDAAQAWRSEGVGEDFVAGLVALDAAGLAAVLHLPTALTEQLAPAIDEQMGAAILGLYRSAPESALRTMLPAMLAAERLPSLTLVPHADPYVPAGLAEQVAAMLDSRIADLGDAGHWWMVEHPAPAAAALTAFWP